MQTDGKIVVAGYSTLSTNDFALMRYQSNGSLDTTFGTAGIVTTAIGTGTDLMRSATIQTDGKILVAGYSTNGSGNKNFALVRYTSTGALDSDFGTGGKVSTSLGAFDAFGESVTIQADGKILLAGNSVSSGSNYDFAIARYNSDGTLDTGFGAGGKAITSLSSADDKGRSIAVQSDGTILVAGNFDANFALARFTSAGALDTGFGTGGFVTTNLGTATGNSLTVQADGKILVAGYSNNNGGLLDDFTVVRYNSNGSLDTSFDAANTLNNTPTYIETGAPVVLDADVQIVDAELTATN